MSNVGSSGQPRLCESVGYPRLGCQMGTPAMPEFALFQEGVAGFASWDKTEFVDLCLDSQNTLLQNASNQRVTRCRGIYRSKKLE